MVQREKHARVGLTKKKRAQQLDENLLAYIAEGESFMKWD